MSRRIIITACLALVIVFVIRWWMPSDRTSRSVLALPDTRFDYTLSDFQSEFFNSEGILEWVMEAPSLKHDSASKMATIESPQIIFYPHDQNWSAQAVQGLIDRSEDVLELVGEVEIRQPLPTGTRTIRTQRLHHDRLGRTIRANEAVEMQDPRATIRAGGLLIDLNADTMEFFNRVQGELYLDDAAIGSRTTDRPQPR